MLQQTRVSTVLPYFEDWLKEFPDFKKLAQASETKVLKMGRIGILLAGKKSPQARQDCKLLE